MADKDKKLDTSPLDNPGFHLLKAGKELVIAGKRFIRLKDVTIKNGDKQHVKKNIKKISYVPNSIIKSNGIDLKHFEPGSVENIPEIKHENVKALDSQVFGK